MQKLQNKKLLILGGIVLTKQIISLAQRLGIEVSVTDYNKTEDSPGKQIADKTFMVSAIEVDEVSQLIKAEQIDGMLTGFVDSLLPYYTQICKKAGIPYYGTKKQFDLLSDKTQFKKLCQEFDISVVEEYQIEDPNDEREIAKLKFPVILKPADNSGGRGISICRSPEEFKEKYTYSLSYSKSNNVLIERLMEAPEVSVFYVLQDGEIKMTAMGDRHIKHFNDKVIPLPVAYTFPSIHLEKFQKNLNDKVIKMFEQLGMKNGMVFIQSFIENGECVFYEMGYRLTGSLEYHIINHASGYNPLQMIIEQAVLGQSKVDLKRLANPNFENKYCNITFLVKPGTIDKIQGFEEVLAMDSVIEGFLSYQEGEEIPDSMLGTLKQVVCRFFVFGKTNQELKEAMDGIYKTFKVYNDKGENMLLPVFDTQSLVK